MIHKLLIATTCLTSSLLGENAQPHIVPAVKYWQGGEGHINASMISKLKIADPSNEQLSQLGKLFSQELELTSKTSAKGAQITLDINPRLSKNKEAYQVTIKNGSITISGSTVNGTYYGTRTLLQMLKQSTKLPKGTIKDVPLYPVRSVLIDVGRKFMEVEDVKDWIRMMGWMKINELHFHLNDNAWGRYPGYRLESKKFPGLASKDGHYTFEQIRELINFAKLHGVVIVPEIDTPGHSLALTTYRPDLAHPEIDSERFGLAYLDLNNPDTIQFVKELWDEVIPLFDADLVHIGTDEYRYKHIKGKKNQQQIGEKFRLYINELATYIEKKHKKKVRMWSGFELLPGTTQPNKSLIIDMWETSDAKAKVASGYQVVNSSHYYTYIVPGAPYYGVDNNFIYNKWTPMQFSGQASGKLSAEDPGLMGGKLHVWNDYGPTGFTWNEIARLTAPSMASFGEKFWGVKGAKNYDEFVAYAAPIYTNIPNVSLTERDAVSKDSNLVWELKKPTLHIANTNPKLNLKADNLEFPWTASFTVTRHSDIAGDETLISSDLAAFYLDLDYIYHNRKKNTKTHNRGVACVRANQAPGWEPIMSYNPDALFFDYQLPVGKKTKLTFVGEEKRTSLYVDGKLVKTVNKQMICPLTRLGHPLPQGFHGTIHKATIKSIAPKRVQIGNWTPKESSKSKQTKEIDITKHLSSAGDKKIIFSYKSGKCRLNIYKVSLLKDGKIVSTDEHSGHTGGKNVDNTYSLKLKRYNKKSKYTLRYSSNSDGGTDSTGSITLKEENL